MQTLRSELRDFYDDYAECLDEDDLENWPSFFTEDAVYRVTGERTTIKGWSTRHCTVTGSR